MKCPRCGGRLQGSARLSPHCQTSHPRLATYPVVQRKPAARRRKGWLVALGLTLVLGFGCYAFFTALMRPTQTPTSPLRPNTEVLLKAPRATDLGYIDVVNGTSNDALVVLTDSSGETVTSGTIRARSSLKLPNIGDGSYLLYFSMGKGWDARERRFVFEVSRYCFDDPVKITTTFRQTFRGTQKRTTAWEVTLNPVFGGNVTAHEVREADFPSAY